MFLGTSPYEGHGPGPLELLSGWIPVQVQGTAHWSPGSGWSGLLEKWQETTIKTKYFMGKSMNINVGFRLRFVP